MHGWLVKLCDPLIIYRPYLSALGIYIIKHYINLLSLLFYSDLGYTYDH